MAITRTFINAHAERPALASVVEWTVDKFASRSSLDLSHVAFVLSGSRSAHQMLGDLVLAAEHRQLIFSPPILTTAGRLPELLYETKRRFAGELVQRLAWVASLRGLSEDGVRRFIPWLPPNDDLSGWLELAQLLRRQHRELAGAGLNFQHVVDYARQIGSESEIQRWRFFRNLQLGYLKKLDECGLWDQQTARLFSIENNACRTELEIVLVAAVDLNRATCQMLDQVGKRVTALLYAPQSWKDRFDAHGCLVPEKWEHETLDLRDDQIEIAAGPAEQADAVACWIAELGAKYRADQIAIGVPDPNIVPWIQDRLAQFEVPSHWVIDRRLADTGPFRLLEAAADYLEQNRFERFAAFVRHPDLYDWLDKKMQKEVDPTESTDGTTDYVSQLDQYYGRRLSSNLGDWSGDAAETATVRRAYRHVTRLLRLLVDDNESSTYTLSEWSFHIVSFLESVYGNQIVNRRDSAESACIFCFEKIREVLIEIESIPSLLLTRISAPQAIRTVLERLSQMSATSSKTGASVEILGWLELPLNTSPALLVTSFNEEYVPESQNSDLFLPDQLRSDLNLANNVQRYARDAYAVSMLLLTRSELRFVVAQRNSQGEPLKPSRLAFATDSKRLARRAKRLFDISAESIQEHSVHDKSSRVFPTISQFSVQKPALLIHPVSAMSVTSFRTYLACPFRFYLAHVLQLTRIDDSMKEMDARSFGNLIHEVLCSFGRSDMCNSIDADSIRQLLHHELNQWSEKWYGKQRRAAVNIQIAQARVRLDAFADWQADWARRGWRIIHTEIPGDNNPVFFYTENGSVELKGRIDRIDQNKDSGEWMVFDYKTSDKGPTPQKAHRSGQRWIDLQLPLYRHLVQGLGILDPGLAYIRLPRKTSEVGESVAKWTSAELEGADRLANNIVRQVLAEEFWPPTDPAPKILREFAPLCNEGVFVS